MMKRIDSCLKKIQLVRVTTVVAYALNQERAGAEANGGRVGSLSVS